MADKDQIKLFVPGRLCLFGEHSDWAGLNRTINPDIVAGCAIVTGIEQGIYATASKNKMFVVKSDLPEYEGRSFACEMSMAKLREVAREGGFFSYMAGVASYMSEWYQVGGIELSVDKMTLPMKSGLSSSAAICVLVVRAFNELYNLHLNTLGIMNIAYWGELRTPSQCGRLDQACAFGVRPVSMIFDGNEVDVEPISVGKTLHFVFADLCAGKDTVKILNDLNSADPHPENDKERAIHEALGPDNKRITDLAHKYISEGDSEKLGALMIEAQELFDRKVAPMCPQELTAPVLHSVLNDENIKKYVYGAKGVGSQGDGTVQFLAKDAENQKLLIDYLEGERKMIAYPLTLQPQREDSLGGLFKGDIYVFGARAIAAGFIRAVRECYEDARIAGCIVSSTEENPSEIEGLKVEGLKEFSGKLTEEERHSIRIVIAAPVSVQSEVSDTLKIFGFENILKLDSELEAELMRRYFEKLKSFDSLKDVDRMADEGIILTVLAVCNNADRRLRLHYTDPSWVQRIQAGAALTDIRIAELNDMSGENISEKNPAYRELTALFWMWKDLLPEAEDERYFGLFQYRRVMSIDEEDLRRIKAADLDAVLPYPMIHVPDIGEHHRRYLNDAQWDAFLSAVKELSPEYMDSYDDIFGEVYFYNYNMFLAKAAVVNELCSWMFPVLEKFEDLCRKNGISIMERQISYLGESMMTWFFRKNSDRYSIAHVGRISRI